MGTGSGANTAADAGVASAISFTTACVRTRDGTVDAKKSSGFMVVF